VSNSALAPTNLSAEQKEMYRKEYSTILQKVNAQYQNADLEPVPFNEFSDNY